MRLALAAALAVVTFGAVSGVAPAAHATAPTPTPTTVTVSAPSFRPAPDGIQDTVTISATVDPSATSVTITVDPGVATWTLTPTLTPSGDGQVTQVWDGTGNGGTDGLAAPGSHTITAVAHTPTGDVTSQTTVTVLIDTIAATRDVVFSAKDGFVQDLSTRCGKLQKPSAHRWRGSIGFNADAKCNSPRKNYAEAVFGMRPFDNFDGHTIHEFTTVEVSVYGGAAKTARRSTAFSVLRDPNKRFLQPSRLSAHVGWHPGPTVPAVEVMYPDHSFAWDVVSIGHSHYDVEGFRVTIGYTYLY